MSYAIPRKAALSFLTTIATTACGVNGEEDLPGKWSMYNLEKQCSARKGASGEGETYEANICFNFTKFAFEIAEEGFVVKKSDLRGYIVQSYLYSEDELFVNNEVFTQYSEQFFTEEAISLTVRPENHVYAIQTVLTWKNVNGDVPIDADLECKLTKSDTITCQLEGIYIEGNNVSHYVSKINAGTSTEPDMVIDAWYFTLKKQPREEG